MQDSLFTGKLVRLTMVEPDEFARMASKGARDSEYMRLSDTDPARMWSVNGTKEWFEKYTDESLPEHAMFMVRTLDGDCLIGDIGLGGMGWSHGDCFVGIGIADRKAWGNGYGTDAMRLALRYAFTELDLHRVSLDVFDYNPRAIRSYEKAGFTYEGRQRGAIRRDGRRWDVIFMGILRSEWDALAAR